MIKSKNFHVYIQLQTLQFLVNTHHIRSRVVKDQANQLGEFSKVTRCGFVNAFNNVPVDTCQAIDDEKNTLELLEWQLQTYCPQVVPVALCTSADEGIAAIKQYAPQLVFLDIEMPRKNGFEVLIAFPEPSFEVIFTTAYDQFAVKAFKFAALDYLLKPIDADDLQAAVERFEKLYRQRDFNQQLNILLKQYHLPQSLPGKIPLATQEGIFFADPQHIVHCDAASNYTIIYFEDKTKLENLVR